MEACSAEFRLGPHMNYEFMHWKRLPKKSEEEEEAAAKRSEFLLCVCEMNAERGAFGGRRFSVWVGVAAQLSHAIKRIFDSRSLSTSSPPSRCLSLSVNRALARLEFFVDLILDFGVAAMAAMQPPFQLPFDTEPQTACQANTTPIPT